MRTLVLSSLAIVFLACGGSTPPPAVSAHEGAAPATAVASAASDAGQIGPPATAVGVSTPTDDAAPSRLPLKCADPSAAVCAPPGDFVDRLCARPHQDLALALFAKATPFTRLYLRGKLDELAFDEEVLALRFRAPPKNGVVVGSANGSYDVLRWDGTCATGVEAEMITRARPPRPRTARVKWHRMAGPTQDALVAASDAIKQARTRRGKECKGAMTGDVSAACEKADQALADSVVDYVRSGGGGLPEPDEP
ncbi:MAG TPA: hypothetical protein VKU41_12540 [Polyangiaceae bacterium]|nr:hypothetical protein [Polyangiaceae bacterium]